MGEGGLQQFHAWEHNPGPLPPCDTSTLNTAIMGLQVLLEGKAHTVRTHDTEISLTEERHRTQYELPIPSSTGPGEAGTCSPLVLPCNESRLRPDYTSQHALPLTNSLPPLSQ